MCATPARKARWPEGGCGRRGLRQAIWTKHQVTLPAYEISKYPITNRDYLAYVEQAGVAVSPKAGWELARIGQRPPAGWLDHPVVGLSWDEAARLWDLSQPEAEPVVLRGHENLVRSVAYSPDGQQVASANRDRTVRLWDLSRPEAEPVILRGHENFVLSLAYRPDGRQLASGSWDNTVRLWAPRIEPLAELGCQKVRRNLSWEEWERFMPPGGEYQRTCPNRPVHPTVPRGLIDEAWALARSGETEAALVNYEKAFAYASDLEISAGDWNALCWFGSLWNRAALAEPACEQAVALDPENGNIRDSRGINRALLGDFEGAVEDFEVFVAQDRDEDGRRAVWIEALQAGENPFNEETLAALRGE